MIINQIYDVNEYVYMELASLERERDDLDMEAAQLEVQLRRAMNEGVQHISLKKIAFPVTSFTTFFQKYFKFFNHLFSQCCILLTLRELRKGRAAD